MKRSITASLAALGIAYSAFALPARAGTFEAFTFSNEGPFVAQDGVPWGLNFQGTFSGFVEPDGNLKVTDLVYFDLQFFSTPNVNGPGTTRSFPDYEVKYTSDPTQQLGELNAFNFEPNAGASTLAFIASTSFFTFCTGAPSVLSAACNPGARIPPSAVASVAVIDPAINGAGVVYYAQNATQVALTPVPESSTWAMMSLGFAGLGLAACRRYRKNT